MVRFLFYSGTFLLLLSSCTSKSIDAKEAANNDSIEKYLDLAGDINISSNDKIDKIFYNDKALKFIKISQNSIKKRELTYQIITNYYYLNNWVKYKQATDLLYKSSLKSNDGKGLAQSYRSYGNYHYQNKRLLDSAFYFYTKAEKKYRQLKDLDGYSMILLKKGIVQYEINDFLGADLSLLKAYSIVKETKDKIKEHAILNQLGLVSNQLNQYDRAITYFNKALKIIRNNEIQDGLNKKEIDLSNLGLVYDNLKNYKKAIYYYNLSLTDKNLKNDSPIVYSNIIDNLAHSKLQSNDYMNLPQMFYESLKIRQKLQNPSAIVTSYIHLSEYYDKIGNKKQSIYFANISLKTAKSNRDAVSILFSLKQILLINNSEVFNYANDYLKIVDSLQISERDSKDRFGRIELETQEIALEKEKVVTQKLILTIVLIVVVLFALLIIIITRQRIKQKRIEFLQSQQKANEEIYHLMLSQKAKEYKVRQNEKRRIAIELHDGVMNKLASTRLNLDILNHKKDIKTIEKCLTYVSEIYNIEQEIRSISHDLAIEDFNSKNSFVTLINDFMITQNNISDSQYIVEMDEVINWDNVSSSVKMNLFRIVQEASHNINKFSNAKTAIISFILDDNNVCLSITDNGKGFDTEISFEGIGLKNIKQRVDSLKGKFVIQSIKGKSTSLNIAIPIA